MITSTMSYSKTINPWLGSKKPNPQAKLRLFCFPYAGGNSSIFRAWQEILPPGVDVCPVEFPGRGARIREKPFTRMGLLIEALGEGLLGYLDIPFAFFGHSMGAVISFELARLLRKRHALSPVRLFVAGRQAPHLPAKGPPTYDLPQAEFLEQLHNLNGTPKEVFEHPELLELLVPILRADFELIQTYEYEANAPIDVPITALGGLRDPDVSGEQLQGWQSQTTASFVLRMLPGDHFFIHTAQPLLLEVLTRECARLIENQG